MSIYLFQVATQKSEWLSARQTAIANNVANASTPGYHVRDSEPFSAMLEAPAITAAATSPGHLSVPERPLYAIRQLDAPSAEETLSGNSVNLEQQMIDLGDVNRDFSMAANIRRIFHQLMLSALK